MFREYLANQEAAGRLLNDSSNDTWQDVIGPPNSVIWDSGLKLAMRKSIDSTLTKSKITNGNCSLCTHSPNIPGHAIECCPVIQKLGLSLPETNLQPNSSSHLVTGPPPPPILLSM